MKEGLHIIIDKYNKSGINTSPEVESAVKRKRAKEGHHPSDEEYLSKTNIDERVQVYLDRLEEIFNEKDIEKKKFRLDFLKQKLYDQFIIKEDEIPESYWQSMIKKHEDEGRPLEEIPEEYKLGLAKDMINEQKDSLNLWIDYFAEHSEQYPDWFKYLSIRNILYLGKYDKQKKQFGNRRGKTLSPFPDLNQEVLNIVKDALTDGHYDLGYDKPEDVKKRFQDALQRQNFKELYEIVTEEFKPIPDELLEIIKPGMWKTYTRGSDANVLVDDLKKWGTGWCIRGLNMAKRYLNTDQCELQVYFTPDKDGNLNVPRIVTVVNKDGKLSEVRGVGYQENSDPYIDPIVDEKLKEFPDGESFRKISKDMKQLSQIHAKCFDKADKYLNPTLTKEELEFLYEVDSTIECFGYDRHPRIKKILKERNVKEDVSTVLGYKPEQIATDIQEVGENTKAYIGPWNIDVYNKIKDFPNITLYESFPDKKIFTYELKTDSSIQSSKQAKTKLESKGIGVGDYGKDLLDKTEYSKEQKQYKLVQFTVGQLGFHQGATTDQVYAKAQELGLKLCPAEVGPQLRLSYPGKDWKLIAMKQISDRDGRPNVFSLHSDDSKLELCANIADPSRKWSSDHRFVFLAS